MENENHGDLSETAQAVQKLMEIEKYMETKRKEVHKLIDEIQSKELEAEAIWEQTRWQDERSGHANYIRFRQNAIITLDYTRGLHKFMNIGLANIEHAKNKVRLQNSKFIILTLN